jgi:thioredoxin-like negative regulator of GroEL
MEAIAGNADDAVRLATSVMATMPESRDAIYGASFRFDLARVYTLVGDKEHALEELTRLVHAPTQLFNVAELREDPAIRALSADARFAALFNDPKNNARLP